MPRAITERWPEWIEWMCAQVGLQLVALKRLRIGRIPMAGLPVGEWRYLPPGERTFRARSMPGSPS